MPVRKVCRILNIKLPEETLDKLTTYAEELCRWNSRVNLTGKADPVSFIEGPLFDALTVISVLEPSGTLVDIGSGGGLPGVPIGLIHPQIELTLVEPRAKRVSFLNHIVHHLGLSAEVIRGRDHDLPREHWSGAVAQAVFKGDDWIPRGAELVADGGSIYVLGTKALDAESLPPDLSIAKALSFVHPEKNARRYATRIVRRSL